MLRNIIFDMGGVMLRWDPPYFIDRLGITDPEDKALLLREVHGSSDWRLGDSGELDEPEIEKRVQARLPDRLHEAAHQLIFHWSDPIEPIPGMAQLVRDLKAAGLSIYLLSNASRRQPEYWLQVPGSEVFDGTVISAIVGFVKPFPDIFHCLLTTHQLQAEECLFVDDLPVNVEGARGVGMDGFVFTGNAGALRHYIQQQLPSLKIE